MSTLAFALMLAAGPSLSADQRPETHIYDGTETQNCQFPTTLMTGGCTATLVSPHVAITAAHCMGDTDDPPPFRMGQVVNAGQQLIQLDYCRRNPEYTGVNNGVNGADIAYCVLETPVYDIPFTPIIYGCETEIIHAGREAWIVGIGASGFDGDNDTGFGFKRYRQTTVAGLPGSSLRDGVYVGGVLDAACGGDSGGPAYIQYPDGTWHVFGVVSGGPPPCGGGADLYAVMSEWVPWIEEDSGLDITPCHDVDGTWNPTGWCQGFELDPLNTDRQWSNFCMGEVSGPSATCGPAFTDTPDNDPPTVTLVTPQAEATYDGNPAKVDIEITADDGDGYGVQFVRIAIDGDVQDFEMREPPFTLSADFPTGVYEVTALAEDFGGNIGESEPARIAIGTELPPVPGASTGEMESGTSDGIPPTESATTGEGNDDEDEPEADGDDGGCGCRATPDAPVGLAPLLLVPLFRRRRR